MKVVITLLYLFTVDSFAKQTQREVEFSQSQPVLVNIAKPNLGNIGTKLISNITKILEPLARKDKGLVDDFGQLQAMYFINFDDKSSKVRECNLYINPGIDISDKKPNIKLISSGTASIKNIKAFAFNTDQSKTYFFRSQKKLIRVNILSDGTGSVDYFEVVNKKIKKKVGYDDVDEAKGEDLGLKTAPLKEFTKLFKRKVKQNEVEVIGNLGKFGIYQDSTKLDTNIQLKVSGTNKDSKNFIQHTHATMHALSDFETKFGVGLTENTGVNIGVGNRTREQKRIYSSDYDLEKKINLTEQQEIQRSITQGTEYYNVEAFYKNSNHTASVLFEEENNHEKGKTRKVIGAKYSIATDSRDTELIMVIQKDVANSARGNNNTEQDDNFSAWLRIKYTY